ncbi:MAG TPA: TaqI-like C-terminal specificity domain-containing protein, partial [Candidatus Woesebacteria bacterium]|nr:TaqI-like C-terminal specificity domain-containing protein [Candidatus Woesebacteria bacterium]
ISIRKSDKPKFSYNNFPCYVSQTFNIIQSDRINLKYFTAVLNSTLIKFWFKNKGKMQGDIFQIDREPLLKVPIYIPNNSQQKEIINFVDEIIKLRTKINSIPINSDQYRNLERETMKIEKEIDQIVYKIYGLKEEEIKILEDSLK